MEENAQAHRKFDHMILRGLDPDVAKMMDMILSDDMRKRTYLTLQEVCGGHKI